MDNRRSLLVIQWHTRYLLLKSAGLQFGFQWPVQLMEVKSITFETLPPGRMRAGTQTFFILQEEGLRYNNSG